MESRIALIGRGSTVTIAAGTDDSGGAFALLDYELAPGFAGLPPHIHEYEDEAAYVLEGELVVRVGEHERLMDPGDFVLLPRGIAHSQRNPGPLPARFLVMLFPAGFERCLLDLDALLGSGVPPTAELLTSLLARYGCRCLEPLCPTIPRD